MGEYNEEFEEPEPDYAGEYENNVEYEMREREPDYPVELNDSQNQFLISQESQSRSKMNNRPKKNKKSKKSNKSITNRSSSAKWKKMDPYIQGQPASIKMLKQMKRSQQADENSMGMLPPITKKTTSNMASVSSTRAYKPLQPPKIQKANSTTLKEMNANGNNDEEKGKPKIAKGSDIDYEQKNLERLQDFQKKKTQELAMMEEERRKAQEKREKLRQIVYFLINSFV